MLKKNKPLVLIIGFGSIGQRHYRNVKKYFNNNVDFLILRQKFSTPLLSVKNKIKNNQKFNDKSVTIINSFKEINTYIDRIYAAFICTPTSKHISQAKFLISKNINTFVEKPLSNNFNDLKKLEKLSKKSLSITMIGYQMRFHPIINFLKNRKNYTKIIGKINFVGINHGENLKDFHPWEDYKKSYTSNKILGGGVTLCQIHEFDYFSHLFADFNILQNKSLILKTSDFDINVDDTSSHLFLLKKQKNKIVCNINLNFYEHPKNRTINYIGSKGKLFADLNNNKIFIFSRKKNIVKNFNISRNKLFEKEISYFFQCIKNKRVKHELDIFYAIKNLKFALKLLKK